jgi:glycosidase
MAKDIYAKRYDYRYQPRPYVNIQNPEWSKTATIYEVNVRQYTREGTFRAFATHLPRLKELGVDILWLMPIHPIGEKNRKGTLGSYYSVKDYLGINPEFGSEDDFRWLVSQIHEMGMYVIIDWVANHSAADNALVTEHPEWYSKNPKGHPIPTPWYDWDDVLDFDYDQPPLRKFMTDAMKYWVREFDIDGFRADVAGFVPIEFWENIREELFMIKPVFMLAEWESRDLHRQAFDMTYAWSLWEAMRDATTGGRGLDNLLEYLGHDYNTFPRGAIRMAFTDNHDKNSWVGAASDVFGDALDAAIAVTCTVKGMPLVYSGQEAGLNRSLSFFEKDEIDWKDHPHADLFRKLFSLKKKNNALWNSFWGGEMIQIPNNCPDKVISFGREKNSHRVLTLVNFSDQNLAVDFDLSLWSGEYLDVISEEKSKLGDRLSLKMKPWAFRVLAMH